MNRYLTEKVTAANPVGGCRLRVTFIDGYTGEVDLSPLLDKGPIFAPLRENFASVQVVRGAPTWPDDLDISPGALRAWCEAGKFLDYEETDAWIERHSEAPQGVA